MHKKKNSQGKEAFQVRAANSTSSYQVIDLDQKTMESNQTEWEEQIRKMSKR